MGLFDSYLADLQKEISRTTDGVAKIRSNTQNVADGLVKVIDGMEEKVTYLSPEEEVKKKLKKKLKSSPAASFKKKKPQKS